MVFQTGFALHDYVCMYVGSTSEGSSLETCEVCLLCEVVAGGLKVADEVASMDGMVPGLGPVFGLGLRLEVRVGARTSVRARVKARG